MEIRRTEDLTEWISTIEREGNKRHTENMERLALLEGFQKDHKEESLRMEKKMDDILDILSQGKGVITFFKLIGVIAAMGGSLALIYEGFLRGKGH